MTLLHFDRHAQSVLPRLLAVVVAIAALLLASVWGCTEYVHILPNSEPAGPMLASSKHNVDPNAPPMKNEPKVEIPWAGRYEYSECAKEAFGGVVPCWGYDVVVTKDGPAYHAVINVDGYQTAIRMQARGDTKDDSLVLRFRAYGEENTFESPTMKVGDVVVTLAKKSVGKTCMVFGKLESNLDSKELCIR